MCRTSSRHMEDGIDVMLVRVWLRVARVRMEGWWTRPVAAGIATMGTALMQALMQRRQLVVGMVSRRRRHGPTMRVRMEAWNAAGVM